MAEIDTSSYPKALPTTSPLDIAGKIGALEQQKLGIDQAKLNQANQALGYMVRAMGSLGPNASKEDYAKAAQNAVDQGLVPQQQENVFLQHLQNAPDSPTFYKQFMSAAQEGLKQIELHTGQNVTTNDQANEYHGKRDVISGAVRSVTQMPIQPPPGAEYYQGGQKRTLGAAGPAGITPVPPSLPVAGPAGAVSAPLPRSNALPVARPSMPSVSGPTGGTVRRTDMEASAAGTVNRSGSLAAAPPPMFEEGKKMLIQDQEIATAKATALKPLEEAYDLAKSVKTGPGTEAFNRGRAYLINIGLISADEKDPTVIYQMLNKNLAQFVDKAGSRSDADLAVKESGNANAKTQVQPALLHMVQKILARERIEIARPSAFEGDKLETYGSHKSNFPTNQDERAYAIDKMPIDEARDLYKSMRAKALNGNLEAIKFMKSLATAKKAGVVNGLNQ